MYDMFTYTFTIKNHQMQVDMPYIECLAMLSNMGW